MSLIARRYTNVAALGGLASPTSADSDVTLWIAAVYAAGGTVSQSFANALTTMIAGHKTDTDYANLDWYWPYVAENATQASIDIVARRAHTLVSAPTFAALQGYSGNGSSSYINTGFAPSTMGVKFTQNNNGSALYIKVADSRGSGAFYGYFCSISASDTNGLFRNSNNTQWNWGETNGGSSDNVNFGANGQIGLMSQERTGALAGNTAIFGDGTSLGAGAVAGRTLTSAPYFVLAANSGAGTPGFHTNARVYFFLGGAALGAAGWARIKARQDTFLTAIGAS